MANTSTFQVDTLLVLKALAAETADTDGTALDVGPLGACKAVIYSTAGWATGTLSISIQQSDDLGSTDHYAHKENLIGYLPATTGAAAGRTTADAFGGVGFYVEIPLNITKRYVRIVSTHEASSGAVSKTYGAFIDLLPAQV
jgi:hypothetical protein